MVKSCVDDGLRALASNFAQHDHDCVRLEAILPTPLAPFPTIPSSPSSSDSDWEDEILTAAGLIEDRYRLKRTPNEYARAPKKARREMEAPCSTDKGEKSLASTAASTPSSTPTASPSFGPIPGLSYYSSMSVAELREHLGVDGTDLAADWNRSELIAVLEHLDRRCMPDLLELEI